MPPTRNLLLASLPRNTLRDLLPQLGEVDLAFGTVLYQQGEPMREVYFPLDALVSLLTQAGSLAVEVGMVGREGVVGIPIALGVARAPMRTLVQGAGTALRMSRARLEQALLASPPLRQALLRYANGLMAQIAQTAACNRFHVVEVRLARWLLMARDRSGSAEFLVTQEFLSGLLGVRRVGVSEAASTFQRRKLIEYSRGRIRIMDHAGLEAACCACYGADPGTLPPWRPAPAEALPTS